MTRVVKCVCFVDRDPENAVVVCSTIVVIVLGASRKSLFVIYSHFIIVPKMHVISILSHTNYHSVLSRYIVVQALRYLPTKKAIVVNSTIVFYCKKIREQVLCVMTPQ